MRLTLPAWHPGGTLRCSKSLSLPLSNSVNAAVDNQLILAAALSCVTSFGCYRIRNGSTGSQGLILLRERQCALVAARFAFGSGVAMGSGDAPTPDEFETKSSIGD